MEYEPSLFQNEDLLRKPEYITQEISLPFTISSGVFSITPSIGITLAVAI